MFPFLKHVFGLCYFGPAHASGIIILDTPRCDLNECSSSSYGWSLFSSKAGSHTSEDVGAMPDKSSSVNVGVLWPRIDQLDEVDPGNTSVAPAENQKEQALHSRAGSHELKLFVVVRVEVKMF
jgi:hypothetical protein